MPTRLLLLSDTHVPSRARALPGSVWRAIDAADVVVHAGDWTTTELLDAVEARAALLVGVAGNNDGPELHERLGEATWLRIEGLRVAVVHETGPKQGRERRADATFPGMDLLVFGHSHIPWDSVSPAGMRLLNPGSPTDRRRQPVGTYLTATVTGDRLHDVELVPVTR
ncbi:metallophosphoesterase family protein [Xylanimonas sp. McL0601]|uniref:metallophosphoesterase family protein n=1 Tax=Xylanimonas sp. McL0601 TaxID=3414739 RepID=UPI003CF05813